jgi:hypothetical protein
LRCVIGADASLVSTSMHAIKAVENPYAGKCASSDLRRIDEWIGSVAYVSSSRSFPGALVLIDLMSRIVSQHLASREGGAMVLPIRVERRAVAEQPAGSGFVGGLRHQRRRRRESTRKPVSQDPQRSRHRNRVCQRAAPER